MLGRVSKTSRPRPPQATEQVDRARRAVLNWARAEASVFLVPTFRGRQPPRLEFADARKSSTRPLQVYRWADRVVPTCNVHRQELAIELDFGYELPTPGAGLPVRQAKIGEERKRAPAEDAKGELV